jgi:hypothetical protein
LGTQILSEEQSFGPPMMLFKVHALNEGKEPDRHGAGKLFV